MSPSPWWATNKGKRERWVLAVRVRELLEESWSLRGLERDKRKERLEGLVLLKRSAKVGGERRHDSAIDLKAVAAVIDMCVCVRRNKQSSEWKGFRRRCGKNKDKGLKILLE